MLSPELLQVVLVALVFVSVAAVVYVAVYPYLSGEKKAAARLSEVASADRSLRYRLDKTEATTRKKGVDETLKDMEARQRAKERLNLRTRILRAGLSTTPREFYIMSGISALVCIGVAMVAGVPPFVLLLAGFVGFFGLPRWYLSRKANKRQKRFIEEFVVALDIIVRGVKSGLPFNDCMQMIATESAEPVRTEFAQFVEHQRIGMPVAQCFDRMNDRMPLPEVNFFSIVVIVQQQTGGNLSEALGNLANVLRDRKRLRGKVQALSSEAKAGAMIIGALPLLVMLFVYLLTPDYISLLWTEKLGNIMLAGSAFWMSIGVLIMRKMINFDY